MFGIFCKLVDLNCVKEEIGIEDGWEFCILVLSDNEFIDFFFDWFYIVVKVILLLKDKYFCLVVIGVEKDKRSEFLKKCCECDVVEE